MSVEDDVPASGRRSVLALSAALLAVELLAGMQRYLSQTVLPLVAADLDGRGLYGVLDAAAQAPMFLMMPIGAWLLSRCSLSRLMLGFTLLTVAGAGACAVAPTMAVFITGTAVRALASGALATIGLGAITRGLPTRYRQLVLAGMSGVWVISSVVGPTYAVTASTFLGWRWAMVLYLPLLLAARFVIARHVPDRRPPYPASGGAEPGDGVPWVGAAVLAAGSAVLAVPAGRWSALVVAIGVALMLAATRSLLPAPVRSARRGPLASPAALGVVAFAYFGATMVFSVVAADTFGLSPAQFGPVIAAPGFTWALAGLWCGSHPALDNRTFRRRAVPAACVLVTGIAGVLATVTVARAGGWDDGSVVVSLALAGAVIGAGMGALYPDLLGRALGAAESSDANSVAGAAERERVAVSQEQVTGAVVLSESVGMALATTTAYTWLATGFGTSAGATVRTEALYTVLVAAGALAVARVAASSTFHRSA